MKNYHRPGWRNDSHRHYLAAKGIKTSQKYYSDKPDAAKRTTQVLQWLADDGRAKTEDFAQQRRMAEIDTLRNDVVGELQEEEAKGQMSFDNAQRFLQNQFTDETKDFMDGKIDLETYKRNVKSRLERHKGVHSKTLSMDGSDRFTFMAKKVDA